MTRPATLEERFWARVDKSGDCWEWIGGKGSHGYGSIWNGARLVLAHRLSFELANGPIATGLVVDHICHRTACVKPAHLRAVTQKHNMENRTGPPSNNTSGVRGVNWNKATGTWRARVNHHGISFHVGLFETLAEAEAAAIAKRNELHTHNDADRRISA